MKLTRFIATIAFYISKLMAAVYFLSALHLLISSIFKLSTLKLLENNRFQLNYPFTNKPFLLGSEYSFSYLTEMVSIIIFYGLFFWFLSNVFKTFRKQKLFTSQGIKNLKIFYITNLIISPVLFIMLSFFSKEDYPYFAMIMGHAIVGLFALFLAAIFNQGVNLQKDQDLFI